MSDFELYIKLASLPENLKKEVGDFAEFLRSKLKTEKKGTPRKAGLAKGLIKMKDGFDDPLEDFAEYMS
jgi:hypothetical protein